MGTVDCDSAGGNHGTHRIFATQILICPRSPGRSAGFAGEAMLSGGMARRLPGNADLAGDSKSVSWLVAVSRFQPMPNDAAIWRLKPIPAVKLEIARK